MKVLAIALCLFFALVGVVLIAKSKTGRQFLLGSYFTSISLSAAVFVSGSSNFAILTFLVFWMTDLASYQLFLFQAKADEPPKKESLYFNVLVVALLLAFVANLAWSFWGLHDADLFQEITFRSSGLWTKGLWKNDWLILFTIGVFVFFSATVGMSIVKENGNELEP